MTTSWAVHVGLVPHVGDAASAAKGALGLGEGFVKWTDQLGRGVPLFADALALQDDVFRIADEVGVGDEVRQAVYAVRTYEYATSVAAPYVAPAAAAAASNALAVAGSVAALGAVAVVVGVLAFLFGGSDEEALDKRQKQARAWANRLEQRLDLNGLAAEQDDVAAFHQGQIDMAQKIPFFPPQLLAESQKRRDLAHKLATFYRRAAAELSDDKRDLFESLSNLARWDGTVKSLATLPSDPALASLSNEIISVVSTKSDAERAHFDALVRGSRAGAVFLTTALLGAASAAGLYYFFAPAAALSLYHGALRAGASLISRARNLL